MADASSETILIVDDEEPVRRTFRAASVAGIAPCRAKAHSTTIPPIR